MGKNNIKLFLIITLLVVFSLSATYAYVSLVAENSQAAVGTGGCFEVNYTGQEITAEKLSSTPELNTTDAIEEPYSAVTLSKNDNCEIYTEVDIKLHINTDASVTAPIEELYALKYKVEKVSGDGKILSGGEGTIINKGDTTLATVSLTETTTTYKVYLWIDSDISLGYYNSKNLSGYIFAESAQTSTIISQPNAPNLDNNNLIPVYYDTTQEVWRKADSSNLGNSWYDYDNKEWANAVMIKDATKRANYQSATIDTQITETDISAFLVWIPRFKYRVWNITRQAGAENTYAYSAYTNGIDIAWERGTTSTGNVKCTYNEANSTPSTTLSDTCVYNGTTTITPNSGNTNFTNAWYTHPAFTFNNEKTGFWIGKFETTGTAESPTVLPDTTALEEQTISEKFTTARVFQTYGISTSLHAHMLTNLEWGAMAYLTASIYGLCDETGCRDVYPNNSYNHYTGRSYGSLNYEDNSTYGTYNYKGYKLNSSTGSPTSTKNVTLVASTTGNITGVYDVSAGAEEILMANQLDENNTFDQIDVGGSWNGSTTLSTFYYTAYSYGESSIDSAAFNRAYLGDATAEVLGDVDSEESAWQQGRYIAGAQSIFVDFESTWLVRRGHSEMGISGLFAFYAKSVNREFCFRLAIS